MDPLVSAWFNIQWLVFNWFSSWYNSVNSAISSIESSGR